MIYILVTGARELRDPAKADTLVWSLLDDAAAKYGVDNILIVHGDAQGIDALFKKYANHMGIQHEPWKANLFATPLIRNKFMVNLVAELAETNKAKAECWAFARKWASGTGHCAREARRRGLHVVDYGVSTEDTRNPF